MKDNHPVSVGNCDGLGLDSRLKLLIDLDRMDMQVKGFVLNKCSNLDLKQGRENTSCSMSLEECLERVQHNWEILRGS